MDVFVWQDSYSADDETIDQEHRHLLGLACTMVRFRASGERLENVRGAVVALCDYVRTHFIHEEEHMAQINYPGLPAHRVLHAAIIHEMNEILRNSANLDLLVYKLKRLLKSWVLGHIQEADRQIGNFLRQRSSGPPEQDADPAATPS